MILEEEKESSLGEENSQDEMKGNFEANCSNLQVREETADRDWIDEEYYDHLRGRRMTENRRVRGMSVINDFISK